MPKKKPKPKSAELTFEESLAELEGVVAALEGGELGLDEALAEYERGVERLGQCHRQLAAAAERIALLSGVDAEGNPLTEPLDGLPDEQEGETLDAKAAARASRRSAGKGSAAGGKIAGVDDSGRLF